MKTQSYIGSRVSNHPAVDIVAYSAMNERKTSFIVDFYSTAVKASTADYQQSFRDISPNIQLAAHSKINDLYRGIIVANAPSKPYTKEATAGMLLVAANMFMDESDNQAWTLVGDGENRRLVKNINDDLEVALNAHLSRKITASRKVNDRNIYPIGIENHDYIMFYDVNAARVNFGFANPTEAGINVYTIDKKRRAIDPREILAAVPHEDANPYQNNVEAVNKEDVAGFLAYYEKLYANTAFFARLSELVRQHST